MRVGRGPAAPRNDVTSWLWLGITALARCRLWGLPPVSQMLNTTRRSHICHTRIINITELLTTIILITQNLAGMSVGLFLALSLWNISAGNFRVIETSAGHRLPQAALGEQVDYLVCWESRMGESSLLPPPSALPGHFIKRAFTSLAKTMSPSTTFIA